MKTLKTKTALNSLIFVLKSHEGLKKDYPEILEILESYLETEKENMKEFAIWLNQDNSEDALKFVNKQFETFYIENFEKWIGL